MFSQGQDLMWPVLQYYLDMDPISRCWLTLATWSWIKNQNVSSHERKQFILTSNEPPEWWGVAWNSYILIMRIWEKRLFHIKWLRDQRQSQSSIWLIGPPFLFWHCSLIPHLISQLIAKYHRLKKQTFISPSLKAWDSKTQVPADSAPHWVSLSRFDIAAFSLCPCKS